MRRITASPAVSTRSTDSNIDCAMIFIAANQCVILISASNAMSCLPSMVYIDCRTTYWLAHLKGEAHLASIIGTKNVDDRDTDWAPTIRETHILSRTCTPSSVAIPA